MQQRMDAQVRTRRQPRLQGEDGAGGPVDEGDASGAVAGDEPRGHAGQNLPLQGVELAIEGGAKTKACKPAFSFRRF